MDDSTSVAQNKDAGNQCAEATNHLEQKNDETVSTNAGELKEPDTKQEPTADSAETNGGGSQLSVFAKEFVPKFSAPAAEPPNVVS